MAADTVVDVDGRRLSLTNLDKPLFPSGFTKAEVIGYYSQVAEAMLPHLRDRPLTLKRYPNGTGGSHFFEKQCPRHAPDWVRKGAVPRKRGDTSMIEYCLANDRSTLVWLANLAAIELHPLLARFPDVSNPTEIVFDLDPGAPADIIACAQVAVRLRRRLEDEGFESFPKTSGSKGLQVYVPLNSPADYEQTKPYANAMAVALKTDLPDLVVEKMDRSLRKSKVLVDWSQNHDTKTTVCAYSLRAMEEPTVSTPVTWEEVESALRAEDAARLRFDATCVLRRLDRHGDLFAPVETLVQPVPGRPRGSPAS